MTDMKHNDAKNPEYFADLLRRGALVGVATETVYGVGADATNESAVSAIFRVKGRPNFNPLICHVTDIAMAADYGHIGPVAKRLMESFWPGPLTLVLPLKDNAGLAPAVTAGLDTVALRCPDQSDLRAVIRALGRPVAAPSANISGRLSPTCAAHVAEDLGDALAAIMDHGPTREGVESTIVAVDEDAPAITMLRPGTITEAEIEAVCAVPIRAAQSGTIIAPGQLLSHYAPDAELVLNARCKERPGDILVGFGPLADADLNLSETADLSEAAHNLFATLRKADQLAHGRILVCPIPDEGIGRALNDRLARAAAPKGDISQ